MREKLLHNLLLKNKFKLLSLITVSALSLTLLSQVVQAAQLTTVSNTISDSRAAATAATHSFTFTTATTGTIATITFQYCTTASGTCTAPTGLTLGTTVGSVTGIGAGTASVSTNTVTYTVTAPASVAASTAITIPFTNVTNPSTANTSFFVRITTNASGPTAIDTGTAAFATLTTTSIAVTATVDPTFTFSVAGVASSGTVNSSTTTVTTTANTIPFGTLSAATPVIAAHDVTVTTNAAHGYIVTVAGLTNPVLTSGTDNIDEFTLTPAVWSSPAGTTPNVNTGYFGFTTEDTTDIAAFAGNKWSGTTTAPITLVTSSVGVSAETTRLGWQTEVNGLQPAGSYAGTVILVATPTY